MLSIGSIVGMTVFTEIVIKVITFVIILSLILYPLIPLLPDNDDIKSRKKKIKPESTKHYNDDFWNLKKIDESHLRHYDPSKVKDHNENLD